jgi:hypothetical protein
MAKQPQQQQPPKQPPQQDQSHPIADQFSDDEMEQVQRYGQALNTPSDFSDEVEKELEKRGAYQRHHEASAQKMRQAQTSGSEGLGPSEAEQKLSQQRSQLLQQQATAGAAGAAQAQQGRSGSPTPPPAPTGPQGVTQPYSSQAGAVGGSGQAPQPQAQPQGPPAAPEGGGEAPPEQT